MHDSESIFELMHLFSQRKGALNWWTVFHCYYPFIPFTINYCIYLLG